MLARHFRLLGIGRWFSTVGLLAAVVLATEVKGSIVLSNLPGNGDYTGAAFPLSTSDWAAVGLTTGPVPAMFESLIGYFSGGGPKSDVGGWIYSDIGGAPGASVATFVSQYVPLSTPAVYALTTTSPCILQANTSYWFVVDDFSPLAWYADTASTVPVAAPGYSFLGYQSTANSGATWTPISGNYTVAIEVQEVPEPSAAVAMLLGATGLLALRRQRRKPQPTARGV